MTLKIILRSNHFTTKQSLYTYDVKSLEHNHLYELEIITYIL